MFESLRSLSDQALLNNTDAIVVQDRQLTVRLLVHLHEIERRKAYLERGYNSMFGYCTRHFRFSEPASIRRIRTARCLARFPELHAMLEKGEVNTTTISMVAKVLRPGNKDELIARIRNKSKKEVQAILAEHEPRALLPPDRVRPIVVRVQSDVLSDKKVTVAGDGEKSSTVDASTPEARRVGDPGKSPGATVSSSASMRLERRAVVQFTAREEVITKLEKVRALASHRLRGNASMEDVIELLADEFIKREDPVAREERRQRREAVPSPPDSASPDPRKIPVRVRDKVFVRDMQQCTYVSTTGKRCGSTHVLQIDHIKPVARGGACTSDNLRVLCAYHNRLEAERLMGRNGGEAYSDR